MPCYDGRENEERASWSNQIHQLRARNDELARHLCEAMTVLQTLGLAELHCSPDLLRWWVAHREFDARRAFYPPIKK